MANVLLSAASILACLLLTGVYCEEEEDGESGWMNYWNQFKSYLQKIYEKAQSWWENEIKEQLKDIWTEMGERTEEAFERAKDILRNWLNNKEDITEEDRDEARNFIERMRMPEERK